MRPRIWTVFTAYVALGIATQVAVATTGLTYAWWQSGQSRLLPLFNTAAALEQTPQGFIICRLPAHLVLLAATLWLGRLSKTPLCERLGLFRCPWSFGQMFVCLGASLGPLLVVICISVWIVPSGSSAMFYDQFTPSTAAVYLGYLISFPAFVEELFFRGYLQRRLLERWSPWVAILVTAILFTLAHGLTPVILLTVFPVALWLGILSWRSNSLWPGCLSHAGMNLIWCGWPLIHRLCDAPDKLSVPVAAYLTIVAALCSLLMFSWLREPLGARRAA